MSSRKSLTLKEFLTFPSITVFFYTKWKTVFWTFVVAGVISVALAFVRDRVYQASATIVVVAPKFSTELNPEVLSVQTYERFFYNAQILGEVLSKCPVEEDYSVEDLGENLIVDTLREKYGTEVLYSPLITLHARAKTPELAATLANTWASVASAQAKDLLNRGKEGVLKFVDLQYSELKDKLVPAENDLATTTTRWKDDILKTKDKWEQDIAVFKAEWNIDRMKAEAEELNKLVAESEAEYAAVDLRVQVAEEKLAKARERQKALQEKIPLHRSITEDPLWDQLSKNGSLNGLDKISLQNEEINPTYTETAKAAEASEIELSEAKARKLGLERDITLQRDKADAVNKLIAEKSKDVAIMELTRDTEVAKMEIEQDTDLAGGKRLVDQYKKTNETLSTMAEAARMAKQEQTDFIKIASKAILPKYPLPTSSRRFFILITTTLATCGAILVLLLGKILSLVDFKSMEDRLRSGEGEPEEGNPTVAGSDR